VYLWSILPMTFAAWWKLPAQATVKKKHCYNNQYGRKCWVL
jgi:hypothetical protein